MSTLVPVMIRTFGRTGSTLLMQVLGTSDTMCFERRYPFEQRYLTYVHNMARMIRLPEKSDAVWNNDTMFMGKGHRVGPLPYSTIEAFDKDELSRNCFKALWQEFSAAMRKEYGLETGQKGFYAEKAPAQVALYANEHLEAMNIFLLRDPRDEMVSIKRFNEKRGFNSFGWQADDSDLSYATRMCKTHHAFLKNLVDFKSDRRRTYVRYEDLIRNGDEEVTRLSQWLGSKMSLSEANGDKAVRKLHMTSASADSSVERWKTELNNDVLNVFSRELGTELDSLGYSV
ncbi:MAG: sulfotransferase [Granulosicoccus sp.]